MGKRIQLTLVLLAWLCSTGAQWDLLQTAGWVRMFSDYSQTMSLTEAVKKTFSGDMCGVCEVVSKAKQSDHETSAPNAGIKASKVFLALQPVPEFLFVAPVRETWSLDDVSVVSFARGAPALPPPRV